MVNGWLDGRLLVRRGFRRHFVGIMKIPPAQAIAILLLLPGCGGAFSDPAVNGATRQPAHEQTAAWEIFRRLDADGNGVLDRREVAGRWTEVFRILDRRGDGRISLDEFVTWPASRQPFTTRVAEMAEPRRVAAFREIDRRRQGDLTLDEFLDTRGRLFDLLDQTGQGVLRPEDLGLTVRQQAAQTEGQPAKPPPPAPRLPQTGTIPTVAMEPAVLPLLPPPPPVPPIR